MTRYGIYDCISLPKLFSEANKKEQDFIELSPIGTVDYRTCVNCNYLKQWISASMGITKNYCTVGGFEVAFRSSCNDFVAKSWNEECMIK